MVLLTPKQNLHSVFVGSRTLYPKITFMYSINITLITDVFFRHFNFESIG